MAKKKPVRKIRFGIRLKISFIMILGIAFTSALIGLAVYNQHENKIKSTIMRLSGTIIRGAVESAETFLNASRALSSAESRDMPRKDRDKTARDMADARKQMGEYFSSIIKKEDILDIAFIIETNWKDVDVDWNRRDQARYRYFHRQTGELFELDLYTRQGGAIKGGRGRDDAQLKPTIFSYYMRTVDTTPYLAFSQGRKDDPRKFVIVGIPLFEKGKNARIYEEFLIHKKSRLNRADDLKKIRKERDAFRSAFLGRIVGRGTAIDYDLIIDSEARHRALGSYLLGLVDLKPLSREKAADVRRAFTNLLAQSVEESKLPLYRIRALMDSMLKEHGLSYVKDIKPETLGSSIYDYARRRSIAVESPLSLDELALISFRLELSGILGIFLLRDSFYAEMEKDKKDIINLIISIFLRATVIALFFPTFIIRSVATLQEAALDIGRGNLTRRIDIKGSDELGRLADIINTMAANLERAQKEMLEKQRMQAELKTARVIQSALLPESFPKMAGLSFGAFYLARNESGGDYYDFIDLGENRLALAMADVSGHGVASGLVMAMTRTLLHVYCRKTTDTKKILELINTHLHENTASNYFVTMFFGILDAKTLQIRFSSAGHSPGIILRRNKIMEIPAGGIALGAVSTDIMSGLTDLKTLQLQRGDYFVQYTDGVYEAQNAAGEEFGMERFHAALLKGFGKGPDEIITGVTHALDSFTGRVPQHDDVTFFVMKIG
jgi:serine phosphatase RsbU (regulator of sigma subunit)